MFSHPRGLLLPCSEHGSAYWLRVGQAGVNMSDASGKPSSAGKRARITSMPGGGSSG